MADEQLAALKIEQETLKESYAKLREDNARLAGALDAQKHATAETTQAMALAPTQLPETLSVNFPEYDGVARKGISIDQFFQRLEVLVDSYGIPNSRRATFIVRCLKGHAFEKYSQIIQANSERKHDYDWIKQELTTYFHNLECDLGFGSADFQNCKQQSNQSVLDYYNDLYSCAKRAYPNASGEVFNHLLLDKFVKGLVLPIKRVVITKEAKDPEAALAQACRVESQRAYLMEDNNASVAAIGFDKNDLSNKVDDLSKRFDQLLSRTPQPPNPSSPRNTAHYFPESHGNNNNLRDPMYTHPRSQANRSFNNPRYNRVENGRWNPSLQRNRNYNIRGDQRCFQCGRFGHFASSCRNNLNQSSFSSDRNPRRSYTAHNSHARSTNTAVVGEVTTTTSSPKIKVGNPYYYLAVIMLLLPLALAYEPPVPMFCPKNTPGAILSLPKPLVCNEPSQNTKQLPVTKSYDLFKRNIVKYETKAWFCKGMVSKVRAFTYFFGDEHLKEITQNPISMSLDLCYDMINTFDSPAGPLKQADSGTRATNNKLEWTWPHWGLPNCCQWHEWQVTNYFLLPAKAYIRHRTNSFHCTVANVEHCEYHDGWCQIDNDVLIWEVNRQYKCEYRFWKTLPGKYSDGSWLSSDNTLALTHQSDKTVQDCNTTLSLSDQGIPYFTNSTSPTEPTPVFSTPVPLRNSGSTSSPLSPGLSGVAGDVDLKSKLDHVLNQGGVSGSDSQAASAQAVYEVLRQEMHFLHHHDLVASCRNMRSLLALLNVLILEHPASVSKTLFNTSLLTAQAANGYLEVWPCIPISKKDMKVLPQNTSCVAEVPVRITSPQLTSSSPLNTFDGYLDPQTFEFISKDETTPVPCDSSRWLVFFWYEELVRYDRTSGTLSPASTHDALSPIVNGVKDDFNQLIPHDVFHEVVMYGWDEIGDDSIGDVWQGIKAQSEVAHLISSFSTLHYDFPGKTTPEKPLLPRPWWHFSQLLQNPFHIWYTITCIVVNLFLLQKIVSLLKKRFCSQVTIVRRLRRRIRVVQSSEGADPCSTDNVDPSAPEEIPLQTIIERNLPEVAEVSTSGKATIPVLLKDTLGVFLFDTGACISLVSKSFILALGVAFTHSNEDGATTVNGEPLRLVGQVELPFQIGSISFMHKFMVFPNCSYDGIIGIDAISRMGPVIFNASTKKVKIGDQWLPFADLNGCMESRALCINAVTIPPRTAKVIQAKTTLPFLPGTPLLFEQGTSKSSEYLCPRLLVQFASTIPIRVVNSSETPLSIHSGESLGICSPVSSIDYPGPHSVESIDLTTKDKGLSSQIHALKLQTPQNQLTQLQEDQLKNLLKQYHYLFATSDSDIPGTPVTTHKIQLNDATPFKHRAYRVPQAQREQFDKKLDEMLESGLIRPSCSPYASPVVLVKKPDGNIRVCIDYRSLNRVTVTDSFPLPRTDESLEFLSGARYFSTLDLYSGFHQVHLHEDSKPYTAFITSRGLFEYNVMPQGAKNSPAAFARLMQFVLSGLLFHSAIIYLDDCLVASKTFPEHLEHLEQVFKRLSDYHLRLKLSKCHFARDNVPFLGYMITNRGVGPDPSNIEPLSTCPTPTTVTAVRSFLGLAGYYRRFIKSFAQITRPLVNLTKKSSRFIWSKDCEDSFREVIDLLTHCPVLAYPNFEHPFNVSTDASDKGCGAILSQCINSEDRPIAFFSKCFTGSVLNYSTVEKEFYAIVLSLKHWKHFVWGHQVNVYTDQQSISWGIKQTDSPRLMKWVALISDFNVRFFYRPGKNNEPADFLSRMPQLFKEVNCTLENSHPSSLPLVASISRPSDQSFRDLQASDSFVSQVLAVLLGKSGRDVNSDVEKVAKSCVYNESSGCVYHFGKVGRYLLGRLLVPSSLVPKIISDHHDSTYGGHQGIHKTTEKILQLFWWPSLLKDVTTYVNSCAGCAARKEPTHPTKEPLKPHVPEAPWNSVVIDLLGPFPPSLSQYRYILVCMDRFTKFPECIPLRNIRAVTVARAFVSSVICRHGVPLICQSDQGTQFTSALFKEVSRLMGMEQTLSVPWHPAANGLVERFNKTLCTLLRSFVAKNQKDWDVYLDLVLFAYRTSTHASTGFTPFELDCGRDARLPIQFLRPTEDEPTFESMYDYVSGLQSGLRFAFDLASRNIVAGNERMKRYYDRNSRNSGVSVGDSVFIRRPQHVEGLTPKLEPKWAGPYVVCTIMGNDFLVRPASGGPAKKWIHANDCKLFRRHEIDGYWPEDLGSDTDQDSITPRLPPSNSDSSLPSVPDPCPVPADSSLVSSADSVEPPCPPSLTPSTALADIDDPSASVPSPSSSPTSLDSDDALSSPRRATTHASPSDLQTPDQTPSSLSASDPDPTPKNRYNFRSSTLAKQK